MSTRTYPEGTLAMITALNRRRPYRAFFTGQEWKEAEGLGYFTVIEPVTVRPLVVIDPDDRKQVERFRDATVDALMEHVGKQCVRERDFTNVDLGNAMQAALRQFAESKPAKPDEPTGLGAVVEDGEGVRWVRVDAVGSGRTASNWVDAYSKENRWSDIDAVRVLSEGVPA